jgi:conjugative transfer region protein TrbK
MRRRFTQLRAINWGCVLPVLVYLAVAGALVAGAIYLDRQSTRLPSPANIKLGVGLSDELSRELARCQALGSRAQDDQSCTDAWALNRQRFFGDLNSSPSERTSHP